MRTGRTWIAAGVLVVSLAGVSAAAFAATAHNSQAGAYGNTKNNCAATPYFAAESGCISPALGGIVDDLTAPPGKRYRYRRALPPPDDDDLPDLPD